MAGEDSSCVCKTASSGFRWLCLARSALAVVVTVLTAVIIIKGLLLVLQPGTTIQLNIAQSDVFVDRIEALDGTNFYRIRFYLEAHNPSEVLFISYRNITVGLYDTSLPEIPLIAEFDLDPSYLSLSQTEEQEFFVHVEVDDVTKHAVEKLFTREEPCVIEGAVMVLSGDLSVANDIKWGSSLTPGSLPFICEPVTVKSKTPLPGPSSENIKARCMKA